MRERTPDQFFSIAAEIGRGLSGYFNAVAEATQGGPALRQFWEMIAEEEVDEEARRHVEGGRSI